MERFKDLDMTGMDWKEVEDYTDLNMSKNMWEELVDLKEAIFFLDLASDRAYYRPAVASELGGYIHIRDRMGKILYSYHVKDNTMSLSSMPSHVLPTSNVSVWECRFGWLLYLSTDFRRLVFFNLFTRDLRKLPKTSYYFKSLCFSAPPTSPDCLVVGFTTKDVYIHFVGRKSSWRTLGIGSYSIRFPTFIGRDLYALRNDGELIGFKNLGEDEYSRMVVKAKAPRSCYRSPTKYYLMSCDQDLLLVIVGEFGEHVEVFKWIDSTQEWKNIDSVGKHMIYICGTTCVCIKAKTP
ncbi:hypothetical protein CTI12_AA333360 [Artemisia annua]|uniref:KIB1-4 beta-propeller domain-containing protein n=1 Tax=Artemisia annua TaxID=35608 RepID=A0A2U1MWU1_ARTAN|nr:hypothetical protein CTI12_AA333360 [Artemisia annua]